MDVKAAKKAIIEGIEYIKFNYLLLAFLDTLSPFFHTSRIHNL
jgi:hypothetical protein